MASQVEKAGGELLYGVELIRIPGVAVRGLYHCVWKNNDGVCYDLTEDRRHAELGYPTYAFVQLPTPASKELHGQYGIYPKDLIMFL